MPGWRLGLLTPARSNSLMASSKIPRLTSSSATISLARLASMLIDSNWSINPLRNVLSNAYVLGE